jgi:hypothetical protein
MSRHSCGDHSGPVGCNAPEVESIPLNSANADDPLKPLPASCWIPGTTGHSCCMAKLIFDNRVVGVLFFFLTVLNAFAIQNGWYA